MNRPFTVVLTASAAAFFLTLTIGEIIILTTK